MKKGFTIIELLIVIAIIAALVGIALPRLRSMQQEGDYAKVAGELRTLQAAVESYYIHTNRTYPATGTNATWQDPLLTAVPRIVPAELIDPFLSSQNYSYFKSASPGDYYVIFSVGPDGIADITGISTAGVIAGPADDDRYVSNGTTPSSGF